MACVASDGSLTSVATQVLGALAAPDASGTAEAVARTAVLPVYRVRAALRELEQAGLIEETGGHRVLTAVGRAKLVAAVAKR